MNENMDSAKIKEFVENLRAGIADRELSLDELEAVSGGEVDRLFEEQMRWMIKDIKEKQAPMQEILKQSFLDEFRDVFSTDMPEWFGMNCEQFIKWFLDLWDSV